MTPTIGIAIPLGKRELYFRRCINGLATNNLTNCFIIARGDPFTNRNRNTFDSLGAFPHLAIPALGVKGVNANHRAAIEHVFAEGADMAILIEEDCVASPDLLPLARCYWGLPDRDSWFGFGFFARTKGQDPGRLVSLPWGFSGPCFAFSKAQWKRAEPYWNREWFREDDYDLGMHHAMIHLNLRYLRCARSRVRHIGREQALHMTPEEFDRYWSGYDASDGSPCEFWIDSTSGDYGFRSPIIIDGKCVCKRCVLEKSVA